MPAMEAMPPTKAWRRLEAEVATCQVGVARLDVGRIGDDGVELSRHTAEGVCDSSLQVEPECFGVVSRNLDAVWVDVGGEHLRVRPLALDGESDAAGARAEIKHACARRRCAPGRLPPASRCLGVE